jgi:pimeloyl-ACP methyl ester carboxylesterase
MTLRAITLIATAFAATATGVLAADQHKPALMIEKQGSFYVGGRIVTTPTISGNGTPTPGIISVDHMYVEYQIPAAQKYRYPVILVHGGGHTGKTYETTPDEREGWYTSFARRGFSPYVVDDPNRGRACCEPTNIHSVRLELALPATLPSTTIYSKENAWTTFRFGPAYPDAYPHSQFPFDAIDQYAAQWVLTYRDPIELDKIVAGLTALIDKLGPCILLSHSQSGPLGLQATLARPDLVKAYIAIEPAGFALPDGGAQKLVSVPLLTVFGDHTKDSMQATNWRTSAQTTISQVNAAGGDGKQIVLPDVGIIGNTHMMMMDRNNEQIADLIENWVSTHVHGVRGRYTTQPRLASKKSSATSSTPATKR